VGNNKGIKSVFFGHSCELLLPRGKTGAQQPKGTNSPKAICALRGKLFFIKPAWDLQRVD
jgi:hypothetical protein